MSDWKIIEPETTQNLEPNPSFEHGTTGWATLGTNTIAQSSERSKYGTYSLKCTYQDNVNLAYDTITLTAAAHSTSFWVYIPSDYDGTQLSLIMNAFTGATGTTTVNADMTKTDQWQLLQAPNVVIDAGDLNGDIVLKETEIGRAHV